MESLAVLYAHVIWYCGFCFVCLHSDGWCRWCSTFFFFHCIHSLYGCHIMFFYSLNVITQYALHLYIYFFSNKLKRHHFERSQSVSRLILFYVIFNFDYRNSSIRWCQNNHICLTFVLNWNDMNHAVGSLAFLSEYKIILI